MSRTVEMLKGIYSDLATATRAAVTQGPAGAGRAARVLTKPFDLLGSVALMPIRGATRLAKLSPTLTFLGAASAGGAMAYSLLKPSNSAKADAPEMLEMQGQIAANQQQLKMVAQAQQEQEMAAKMATDPNIPTTRLSPAHMAQLNGMVAAQAPQLVRA
jgi:hypothetical protein